MFHQILIIANNFNTIYMKKRIENCQKYQTKSYKNFCIVDDDMMRLFLETFQNLFQINFSFLTRSISVTIIQKLLVNMKNIILK